MPKRIKNKPISRWKTPRPQAQEGCLRIVGGKFRGRQLAYSGDPRTRPMKDNVREALFNLVGAHVPQKQVIDLFAGTGAIGLEALSRGASHALMLERHIPTARIIEENVAALDVANQSTVLSTDTFFWYREFSRQYESQAIKSNDFPLSFDSPWGIFCCPPYILYEERRDELMSMVAGFRDVSPPGSFIVCETDSKFRLRSLPDYENWRIKHYSPAVLCVYYLESE